MSSPSAAKIPAGPYCYASLSEMDERGRMMVNGLCPYWEHREMEHAYCRFLGYHTEFERELLWDQVKVCGENDDPSARDSGETGQFAENANCSDSTATPRKPGP